MSTKNTEWKRILLSKEQLDFSGAIHSALETDGDSFLSLTLKLKSGRTVRIRKSDYSIALEEPVVPMKTKYIAKTNTGLSSAFDTREEADNALFGIDGEVQEVIIPIVENKQIEELPF